MNIVGNSPQANPIHFWRENDKPRRACREPLEMHFFKKYHGNTPLIVFVVKIKLFSL